MEIKINTQHLLKAVSRVQSIIEKGSNMPILSTILLTADDRGLRIAATDLELAFEQELEANILEKGSITVSGRKLFEILKESHKEEFHIREKENHWVYLSDGAARFNLACMPADEYPTVPEPEEVSFVKLDGEALNEMINKTIYCVTLEEAGFKLSGIFVEKRDQEQGPVLRMVATDGHRLSLIDNTVPGLGSLDLGQGVMLPKKGMTELNKMAAEAETVELGFKEKNCVAKREGMILVIRLLEARFPDYSEVIPREEKIQVKVERHALLDGMKKMLILSNERSRAVKIVLENNEMELISTNPDLGNADEKIPVQYGGEQLEAGFNPRYFVDTLQSMESDEVILAFVDSTKPCVIRGEADEGFLGLIMPMRL